MNDGKEGRKREEEREGNGEAVDGKKKDRKKRGRKGMEE